ncbi:glycine betaine ABC transporter substrate-binding protein [Lentibacillus sp. Marseille-P4043]|uniref:glycine betaine ABC transporter substrate-binding protein n=1 Tax=Lentibacillus sp. Marseille-P4043 TaxID=2040293 RepID=UPI000D0BC68F|nr:glycine betaine ABC transporter substrate-binding protein [Lentibacillus sp. Marseille-P4043]
MRKTYRVLAIAAIFLMSMVLVACGDKNDESDNAADNNNNDGIGEKDITLGTDDYVSNTSNTYVAKLLLEEIGYNVEITQTDVGVEYTGLADGSTDALVGAWLPTTHKSYWEKYKDNLEKINTVTEEVKLGLTVPAYMEDINSIEDLADNKNDIGEKLEWKITGISPGAGEMKITKNEVMPGYGLDKWELVESSGPAMAAVLSGAIDKEEPIVVTLWTPHWTFNKFDLKILEDPKGTFGEPDDVFSVARDDFKDQSPAAYKFLKQFSIEQEDTQEIMLDIADGMDEEAAAQKFIDDHPDLKDEWLKGFE